MCWNDAFRVATPMNKGVCRKTWHVLRLTLDLHEGICYTMTGVTNVRPHGAMVRGVRGAEPLVMER